jgi:hypothetical protein
VVTDPGGVHEERPSPGSFARFTLDPAGLVREEFTSGVPTHRQVIPYGEVWDTYTTRSFPRLQAGVLAALTLCWLAAVLVLGLAPALTLVNAFVLGFAWALVLWRARVVTLKLFDYEGYELAALHGLPGPGFDAFTAGLRARVAAHRYPLQSVFEAMDLGRCEIKGTFSSWTGVFLYDRVVFESSSIFGRRSRTYHALTALEAPIHLSWRVPWALVGTGVLAAAAGLAVASEALRGETPGLWPWAYGLGLLAVLQLLASAALVGVAVEVSSGTHPIRTPHMPWWRRKMLREALAWFARLVQLADLLEVVRTDDYWDFHRAKLKILREAGFIEDWPYRSALARLNAQEREELGE